MTSAPEVSVPGPDRAPRKRLGPYKRAALLVAGTVIGLGALVEIAAFVEDVQVVQVRFVNDTGMTVTLPDCSTDIATVDTGEIVSLPVAPDHPEECTVDEAGGRVRCVTMPRIIPNVVVWLSKTHRCH